MEEDSLNRNDENSQKDELNLSNRLDEIKKAISSNIGNEPTETNRAEEDKTTEIDKLTTTILEVKNIFQIEMDLSRRRVYIFMSIAIVLSCLLISFYVIVISGCFLPDFDKMNPIKTWYEITLRVMFVSFFISIIVFCLRMMQNYLALYEQLRHKVAIISSMPRLVYGSQDEGLFKTSYAKIIDLLIQLGDTKGVTKNDEILKQPLGDLISVLAKKTKD